MEKVIIVADLVRTNPGMSLQHVEENAPYYLDRIFDTNRADYHFTNSTVYMRISDFDADRNEQLDHFGEGDWLPAKTCGKPIGDLTCGLEPEHEGECAMTFDLTPEVLKTPEGRRRVAEAERELNDAVSAFAHVAAMCYDDLGGKDTNHTDDIRASMKPALDRWHQASAKFHAAMRGA